MGLASSDVLSTFPKPTLEELIPEAILAFVMTPIAISGLAAVPVRSPASLIYPLIKAVASSAFEPSTYSLFAASVAVVGKSVRLTFLPEGKSKSPCIVLPAN